MGFYEVKQIRLTFINVYVYIYLMLFYFNVNFYD